MATKVMYEHATRKKNCREQGGAKILESSQINVVN